MSLKKQEEIKTKLNEHDRKVLKDYSKSSCDFLDSVRCKSSSKKFVRVFKDADIYNPAMNEDK